MENAHDQEHRTRGWSKNDQCVVLHHHEPYRQTHVSLLLFLLVLRVLFLLGEIAVAGGSRHQGIEGVVRTNIARRAGAKRVGRARRLLLLLLLLSLLLLLLLQFVYQLLLLLWLLQGGQCVAAGVQFTGQGHFHRRGGFVVRDGIRQLRSAWGVGGG
jgi:hypothetical protein